MTLSHLSLLWKLLAFGLLLLLELFIPLLTALLQRVVLLLKWPRETYWNFCCTSVTLDKQYLDDFMLLGSAVCVVISLWPFLTSVL